MQNLDRWETYNEAIGNGHIALNRAYRPSDEERLIRELVLQLKRGSVQPSYFRGKYDVDILTRFAEPIASLEADGVLAQADPHMLALTRDGLLQVDTLLRRFFLPAHAEIRYT
jgi:oxygen-independent coproporphyrinogen-3 oxidase